MTQDELDTEQRMSLEGLLMSPIRIGIGEETRYRNFRIVRIPSDCGDDYSIVDVHTRDEVGRVTAADFESVDEFCQWADELHQEYWGE
jgi:hypothetical protein